MRCGRHQVLSVEERLSSKSEDEMQASMLSVGLEIPSFRAQIPLFKSFATMTRDSLLYAETRNHTHELFFRQRLYGFRQVVQHVLFHVAIWIN